MPKVLKGIWTVLWVAAGIALFATLFTAPSRIGEVGRVIDGLLLVWVIGTPVFWLARKLKREIAARHSTGYPTGRCTACGYDLRATPDRCPECGNVPAGR